MCWSIKEVNKNLADRKQLTDYSIKYLKDACLKLAVMMKEAGKTLPGEEIELMGKSGKRKSWALEDIAEMLNDPRKIVELNLIDNIDRWARTKAY